ncbi:hypothetical protein D3C79_695590 [compost metagenome]
MHSVDGFLGQQGPPQVGVQHGAGEVEHAADLTAVPGNEALAGAAKQHRGSQFGGIQLAEPGVVAQVVEQLAQAGQDSVAAVAVDQREAGGVTQQGVDGGQAGRELGEVGRHSDGSQLQR